MNETPDPNKCGCRNLRCCEETGHRPGACTSAVATKFWTFRWEYYCQSCRGYQWAGNKVTWVHGRSMSAGTECFYFGGQENAGPSGFHVTVDLSVLFK